MSQHNDTAEYMEPVFIKHGDLKFLHRRVTAALICSSIDQYYEANNTIGAQKRRHVWEVFASNSPSRDLLIKHGFTLMNTQIAVYGDDPTDTTPSEKLVIKDLPMKMPDDVVLQFLRSAFPNHNFKSRVMKAKDEVSRYKYSKYLTGDRLVYIQAPYPSPFPLNYAIDGSPCRFWHATQNTKCKRCNATTHSTMEYLSCKAYRAEQNIRAISDPADPLCNFYICDFMHREHRFISSEHAYQYEKCINVENEAAAKAVLEAPSPRAAKDIASTIPQSDLKDWHEIKDVVMYNILVSKAKCVPVFKHALMDSGTSYLVEATSDLFWGCGLNAELATTTHFKYYLGYNVLGYVLSKVRTSLTEPSTNDASAIPTATNHPDETDVTTRTDTTLDKEISATNPPTVPDNPAHSPSSNISEFDHKSEVITTPEPTAQSTDLDITTPSTQTPDATTDDNLTQNRALTPLLTSEPEDSNEQFITPLLTPTCSSGDLRDVGHSHDVLSKQLFSALSGLISTSKGSPKVVRKKITKSARSTNSHTPQITSFFDGSSKRKASSDLPSPPASQRVNCSASPEEATSQRVSCSASPEEAAAQRVNCSASLEEATSQRVNCSASPEEATSQLVSCGASPEEATSQRVSCGASPEEATSQRVSCGASPGEAASQRVNCGASPEEVVA